MVYAQTSSSQGWFCQYPKPQGNTLYSIAVIDSSTAIAVGDLGTVIKTTNDGATWNVRQNVCGVSSFLYNVYFLDKLHGWASGGKYLLQTQDGGETWSTLIDTMYGNTAVYFINPDTGWVCGVGVKKTTDGGKSWTQFRIYTLDDTPSLTAMSFVDAQTGWVVGYGFYGNSIYKTTNGGDSWFQLTNINPTVYGSTAVQFVNKDTGWVVGFNGSIIKTTDGGGTWLQQRKNGSDNLYGVHFIDANTGWAVGCTISGEVGPPGLILMTTDGGGSWIEQNSDAWDNLYSVDIANGVGWVVGWQGMIYKTNNAGGNWISQRDKNYNFKSIYFVNENTGWAVGDSGIILSTTNGGDNWIKQFSADSIIFSSVYAIDNQNVFTVGTIVGGIPALAQKAIILRTTNSGLTWTNKTDETIIIFNSVFFTNDSIGWISGPGTILKTKDKGTNWNKITLEPNMSSGMIQFINENIGWSGKQYDTCLWKTTDGGKNWSSQSIDSELGLFSFHFVNFNVGWVVGEDRGYCNVFKTTDGGENWTSINNVPKSNYSSVRFINENIGWIAGGYQISGQFSSTIIKTTDGGNTWINQDCPTTQELSSLFFINENTGWVVGDGIFKTTNGGGAVSVKENKNYIPKRIELFQNYPNPFNPSTTIEYQIPPSPFYKKGERGGFVSLKVYDLLGREVATLVDEKKPAGKYTVRWNAEKLSSGVYFYRLRTGVFSETKKMILIR
jgi:photosystem II stability/assembly factor-like uncharacterized protein